MNEIKPDEESPTKPWSRFGLKSLLLFVSVVALSLGAYQYGRQVGYEEGDRTGFAAGFLAKEYLTFYYVSDLLPQKTNGRSPFQVLMDEITANVQPTTWESAGGPGTMVPDPQNLTLQIVQTERGHDQIAEFLESKRAKRGPLKNSQAATAAP